MNLEEKTIQFIQKAAESYQNETLYAGNSGGKDSAVLDYLLQKSGIKYESYYTRNTVSRSKMAVRAINQLNTRQCANAKL